MKEKIFCVAGNLKKIDRSEREWMKFIPRIKNSILSHRILSDFFMRLFCASEA